MFRKMSYNEDFIKWCRWSYLAAVLLCTQIGNCHSASISAEPPNPTVGQSVLLKAISEEKIVMIKWYRGSGSNRRSILEFNPTANMGPTTREMYTGREEVMKNGSLKISNLTASDSGIYSFELTNPEFLTEESLELIVNDREASNPVTVKPNSPVGGQPITSGPLLNSTAIKHKDNNRKAVIGAVIGSVVAVTLIVSAVVIYFKKCRKPSQTLDEKPPLDTSFNPQKNEGRRLPSIPTRPVYQNQTGDPGEHPYEDLAYVYLSSSYHNLHGQQPK